MRRRYTVSRLVLTQQQFSKSRIVIVVLLYLYYLKGYIKCQYKVNIKYK